MKNNDNRRRWQLIPATLTLAAMAITANGEEDSSPMIRASNDVDAGRYLVTVGGCNDCHTPGWMENAGTTPEANWLTGTPIGWRGPWGTTYASNLRLLVQDLDEDAFVAMLKTRSDRPPMPWMGVNRLADADARAIYRFIRSLGSAGERMPPYVEPGVEPATPYFVMEPQHMERLAPAPAAVQAGGQAPAESNR
jgi:mono/diheme cytochrome c family protein